MSHDARIIPCTERHLPAIRDILNDAILTSTVLWDEEPRTLEGVTQWFEYRQRGGFPILGIESAGGALAGFATYGTFRTQCGYRFTVEHSVYVEKSRRGQGIGKALLRALIDTARAGGIHTLIGAIDASNQESIRFHQAFGFVHCGSIREAGRKFGRWLDLDFYQLILRTPGDPTES
jgi:phosphinothricin acetyltransferase